MAGEVPPLNVEILVQLANLTSAVTQATEGMNKIGDAAKAQESKFSSLKTVMGGVFAGNLMTEGVMVLQKGLEDAVQAIKDTQVATERLSTALNNSKQNTAANREEIEKTSDKMSTLGFSTAQTESAYGTLITATGSATESTKLMSMAADLARYKHEDLATAAATLARGTTGSAKAFRELGITLDTSLPKNQAIAKAFDELNGKIGGQAVGYTHTFAGEMEVLKAKFDDIAVKVGAVVMPILTKFLEIITKFIIPAITDIIKYMTYWERQLISLWNTHEGFRKVVVDVLKVVVEGFGYLLGAVAKVIDTVAKIPVLGAPFKAMGKSVDEAAVSVGKFGQGLDDLANKKISIGGKSLADQLSTAGVSSAGGDTGVAGQVAGGDVSKAAVAAAKKSAAAVIAEMKKQTTELMNEQKQVKSIYDQMNVDLRDYQTQYEKLVQTHNDAIAKANLTFNQAQAAAQQTLDQANLAAAAANNDAIAKLQQDAADKQLAIVQQSEALLTNEFANVTKIDLGKSFFSSGTTSGLIDSFQSQLNAMKTLATDASKLAGLGYSQNFIQQVVAQGPLMGDQMAQTLINAQPGTTEQIQNLFAQVQDASTTGLNGLADQMNQGGNLATQALIDQYNKVTTDLNASMATQADAFNDVLAKNKLAYNDSVAKAQQTLQDSLAASQQAFDQAATALHDSTITKLNDLQTKLEAVAASMAAVNGTGVSMSSMALAGSVATPYLSGSAALPTTASSGPAVAYTQNNYISTPVSASDIASATYGALTYGVAQGIASKLNAGKAY